MITRVLKVWMPRSLFGRSALILLVPVIVILLVVTVVFFQRQYEDVTRQMTVGVAREVLLILDRVEEADDPASALEAALTITAPLGIEIAAADDIGLDRRHWTDISGLTVISTLREAVPNLRSIDLEQLRGFAVVTIQTGNGLITLDIHRYRLNAKNPHQFLVLIGFTALLMLIIALIYLGNQMRPIRRLALAAEAFGKGRVVPYRPAGATEVRLAGTSFLDMRDRIERQIEQRTMMLSGVSHDLRTPLTRMKLGLSLMDQSEETKAMERDVADMESMLEAFLSFARGEAAEAPVRSDPLELVRISVRRAARSQPVQLGTLEGEGTAMLRPISLRRALDNLISNAVRYGNEARVSASISDEAIRLIVEDSGPGIPANERDFVLKPFSRLDQARNQDHGSGVGLGLSIASDIARQHGGALSLGESHDLGGLRAEISIPR